MPNIVKVYIDRNYDNTFKTYIVKSPAPEELPLPSQKLLNKYYPNLEEQMKSILNKIKKEEKNIEESNKNLKTLYTHSKELFTIYQTQKLAHN